jgi:hypothetical protein
MREDVRQAPAIDASSTIEDRTIDITTTGRRSGEPPGQHVTYGATPLVQPRSEREELSGLPDIR